MCRFPESMLCEDHLTLRGPRRRCARVSQPRTAFVRKSFYEVRDSR